MSPLKEFVVYWYFRLPRWFWTLVVIVLIVLFHLLIAAVFPDIGLGTTPLSRITQFYLIVCGFLLALAFCIFLFESIHEALPKDSRKKKKDQQ